MTPHTPEEWNPFVIVHNTMPPRDPEEDEEDGDEEEEEEEEKTRRMRRSRWTRAAVPRRVMTGRVYRRRKTFKFGRRLITFCFCN